ncbi:hypothetical protein [Desulfonatronovibrio magnus]|uniref:hypothetical protein n=1 Tax=Desulfonatronovibrio magnus TaxID=698827 RepID=UPI0005EB0BBD|nr:hypothetical protein [Desulfonatronovibrio magnus]
MLKFKHVSVVLFFLLSICIAFPVQASSLSSFWGKEAVKNFFEMPVEDVSRDNLAYSTSSQSAQTSPPPIPELLFPADGAFVAGTSIVFRWESADGAENYSLNVVRQSDGTVHFSRFVGKTTRHSVSYFSDDGEIYCWRVSAGNEAGWSDYSDELCFTNHEAATEPTVPTEPRPLYPADGSYVSGTSITFEWEPSPGATHYILNVFRPDIYMQFCFEDDIIGTSHTCSYFPDDGTEFEWSVAAVNEHGMSQYAYGGSFVSGESKEESPIMEKAVKIFSTIERLYPDLFYAGSGLKTYDEYEHLMIYQEYPEAGIALVVFDGVVYYLYQGQYYRWYTVEEWLAIIVDIDKAERVFSGIERLYPEWFAAGTGLKTYDGYAHLMIYQEYPEAGIALVVFDGVVYYFYRGLFYSWFTVEEWLEYLGY